MEDLKISGYGEKERQNILIGGINTYSNIREKEIKGERPFYRPHNFRRVEREHSKRIKIYSWFRRDKNVISVMFVEATPGDKLLKMLRETEHDNKISDDCRIKFVSKAGIKLKHLLVNRDPFENNCDCKPCESASEIGQVFPKCKKARR